MPTLPHTLQMRRRREVRRLQDPLSRVGFGLAFLLCLALACGTVFLTLAYSTLFRDLPSLEMLPALMDPPNGQLLQPTRLYDRSGEHLLMTLQNPAAAQRRYLHLPAAASKQNRSTAEGIQADLLEDSTALAEAYAMAPAVLISATLATSDPDFVIEGQNRPGFSLVDFMIPAEARSLSLAQRLVTDLLLEEDAPAIRRSLRQRMLAAQLMERFGWEKILEWYLNSANYGRLAYGADAAARVYFGKPATQLNLSEAALLAGIAGEPGLNPIDAPAIALQRQKSVIQALLDQGWISGDEAIQALQADLVIPSAASTETGSPLPGPAPAFTRLALEQLADYYKRERLDRGGFRVLTTLDYDLQTQANCTTAIHLSRLAGSAAVLPTSGQDGNECTAARLLPALPDIHLDPSNQLAANVAVLDPSTGQIHALVGETTPGLDPAVTPGHPPGSLLTPFIYLSAFTRGFSPATLVWDVPGVVPDSALEDFNEDYHGPGRMRTALANDWMAPALGTLAQIGPDTTWRIAQQLGLDSMNVKAEDAYTLPLDGGEIQLIEAVQAFGALSNMGTLVGQFPAGRPETAPLAATTILRVEDSSGQETLLDLSVPSTRQSRAVISPALAYLVTHVLSDEPARWPSMGHPNFLEIGRPAAVKLGRTVSGRDGWGIGYTPQRVVGVWVGLRPTTATPTTAEHSPIEGELVQPNSNQAQRLPQAAAALWRAVTQWSHRDLPVQGWTAPPGLSQLTVCETSGMLPTPDCAAAAVQGTVTEIFLTGSEPQQRDTLYQSLPTNRENGLLATVFTPPSLIEERVFLLVPPEAQGWAQDAGLPIPPAAYDPVLIQSAIDQSDTDVQVLSPAPFSILRDQVQIQGSAGGEDFSYFRVQVGQGLNPREWLQLGIDISQPVSRGRLGTWDTSGLDGLYVLHLLTVRKDRSVESVFVPVTVDNQPPQAEIRYPSPDQQIPLPATRIVTFQARPQDNLAIASVEIWVDGSLTASLPPNGPYAFPWQAALGKHTLELRVTDSAGNRDETRLTFSVR